MAAGTPNRRQTINSTYVDLIQAMGLDVHLAHPLGLNWGNRRRKDDRIDARDLGGLPESWIAQPAIRELRELVRYRSKLVSQRTSCKAQGIRCWPKRGWRWR